MIFYNLALTVVVEFGPIFVLVSFLRLVLLLWLCFSQAEINCIHSATNTDQGTTFESSVLFFKLLLFYSRPQADLALLQSTHNFFDPFSSDILTKESSLKAGKGHPVLG